MSQPTCGNCGYNLSGSENNRCPECGQLFIEAGVRVRRTSKRDRIRRAALWILVLALGSVAGFCSFAYFHAKAAQERAAMQRLLASQGQQIAQLEAKRQGRELVSENEHKRLVVLEKWCVASMRAEPAEGSKSGKASFEFGTTADGADSAWAKEYIEGLRKVAAALDAYAAKRETAD